MFPQKNKFRPNTTSVRLPNQKIHINGTPVNISTQVNSCFHNHYDTSKIDTQFKNLKLNSKTNHSTSSCPPLSSNSAHAGWIRNKSTYAHQNIISNGTKVYVHNQKYHKNLQGVWIIKPPMPPPMHAVTPESKEEKQRMWREYRQAMKPFKNREFANAKRTIQRLGKRNPEELDQKERVRLQRAQDTVADHKMMLSQTYAMRLSRAQNSNSTSSLSQNNSSSLINYNSNIRISNQLLREQNHFVQNGSKCVHIPTQNIIINGSAVNVPIQLINYVQNLNDTQQIIDLISDCSLKSKFSNNSTERPPS